MSSPRPTGPSRATTSADNAGADGAHLTSAPPAGRRVGRVRPRRVLAAALATGTLMATAACSGGGDGASGGSETAAASAAAALAERPVAASASPTPTKTQTPTPSPSPTLTDSGARSALITEADIEDAWTKVSDKDAENWHESLLIGTVDTAAFLTAKADAADCQRLLDGLYDEELLGKPAGASALTGFEEGESRLLYQVAAYQQSDLDKSMDWLESLPDTCDQFTAKGDDGSDRTVQVVEASLPKEGDGRRGLTVTVKGTADGEPVTLTLDVAVVQVGTNAITVTNGGLDGADHDSTVTAVQQGTPGSRTYSARTPKATPNSID